MKKQTAFFVLSLLWGFPMTLIGAVVAFALILVGVKPERHGWCWYFTIGDNWGGVSLGCVFLVDNRDNRHTKNYEYCTNLTAAPALPATTLAECCYRHMFYDCTSLRISSTLSSEYHTAWRIPSSGTISSTASKWNTAMLSGTGGTFTGDPTINTTHYGAWTRIPSGV